MASNLSALTGCIIESEQERYRIAEIYEEHKHALLLYALKVTGYNHTLAEDAVHNAFLSIIISKDRYLSIDSNKFQRLAFTIVRNKCIDLLRKEKPYVDITMDMLETFLESNEKTVVEQVMLQSEYDKIREYLMHIDETSKQVLIMKYVFGMSYKEIGKKLNMTSKHVDTRILRAKGKIRKLAEKEKRQDITFS
jgi:RNA polymerase sigma-70 factor (ECF subfamily)